MDLKEFPNKEFILVKKLIEPVLSVLNVLSSLQVR